MTVTHAVRTELEISADTAMAIIDALVDAGYLRHSQRPNIVLVVSQAVPIALGHLRDAMARRETHRYTPPLPRPTIAGSVPTSIHRPPDPVMPSVRTRDRSVASKRLRCSTCGHTNTDPAFATCADCRAKDRVRAVLAKEIVVETATALRGALRSLAPSTDLVLNEGKTGFELVCRRCQQRILPGEAIEHVACPGRPRSAENVGEAHGQPTEPIGSPRPGEGGS